MVHEPDLPVVTVDEDIALRHPTGMREPKTMAHANPLRTPVNDFMQNSLQARS
jgi:hypothetical protein